MRIFCWSISSIFLAGWAFGRIHHPGNADFPHDFILFRYALDILFVNIVMVFAIWPLLVEKKVIGSNYHEENKFGKSKIFLILNGLYFPGILLILISSWLTKTAHVPATLITILYSYGILKNGVILLREIK
jgi:hypothetical protein